MKLLERNSCRYDVIQAKLNDMGVLVHKEIAKLLPKDNSTISKAMRYSCLEATGKKIRPFLLIETAKLFGIELMDVISLAAAIEIIHVYTLIHDDLPAMDNDDYRRGKVSCHKKFDEATAILTGNALLIHGIEIFSQCKHIPASKRIALISAITQAVGVNGMVKGQQIDLESKGENLLEEEILLLHKLKTGSFISFACTSATIITNCSQQAKVAIENFASNLGLIFQITDDILDEKQKVEQGECNIVTVLGMDSTLELLKSFVSNAEASLDIFGNRAETLKNLMYFILHRQS